MALTDAQKAKVALYLGWSARFYQLDTSLDQGMSAIATKPESEAIVIAEIAACEDIDAKLTAAHARMKASEVGSITLRWDEIHMLRSEGRRHVARISGTLGVPRRYDVFSGYSPRILGAAMVGGNYTPQG